jgi:hypothetical protein
MMECRAIFTAVGGWLGYFLGGCDGLIYTLLAFVILDRFRLVIIVIIFRREPVQIFGGQVQTMALTQLQEALAQALISLDVPLSMGLPTMLYALFGNRGGATGTGPVSPGQSGAQTKRGGNQSKSRKNTEFAALKKLI